MPWDGSWSTSSEARVFRHLSKLSLIRLIIFLNSLTLPACPGILIGLHLHIISDLAIPGFLIRVQELSFQILETLQNCMLAFVGFLEMRHLISSKSLRDIHDSEIQNSLSTISGRDLQAVGSDILVS